MTSQAKKLEAVLKRHGIADRWGYLRVGECGYAVTYVRAMTKDEIAAVTKDLPLATVKNHKVGLCSWAEVRARKESA